jgi:ElaB/YqjD/DUF883 family membrane-anchored ribosome-binding protein
MNESSTSSGFSPSPSVAQAAHDLRAAAEGKMKDLAEQALAVKERALEGAAHLREITTEKAREARAVATEKAAHLREAAQEQWDDTRERAREWHTQAEDYVREHPTKCVLGALGVGFLIGLIARR